MRTLDTRLPHLPVHLGECIMQKPVVEKLLNPTVLEVHLNVLYEVAKEDNSLNSKNFRFSSYRSIFLWLFKGKRPKGEDYR